MRRMALEDLKRWHWALIGLLGGLILGLAHHSGLAGDGDPGHPTIKQPEQIIPLTVARDFETGRPIVDGLTIHPTRSADDRVQLITFDMRQVYRFEDPARGGARFTRTRWEPRQIWTEIPYDEAGPPGNTFGDRVRALQGRGLLDGADVSFAWWKQPAVGTALYAAAGVLLLGGVWPTFLGVLLGAGFGRERSTETYDLERFGGEGASATDAVKGRRGMSDDEAGQLAAVTGELENSTRGMTADEVSPGGTTKPDGPAVVRPLPQENVPAPAPPKPEEDREYGGVYYPVARTNAKKDE